MARTAMNIDGKIVPLTSSMAVTAEIKTECPRARQARSDWRGRVENLNRKGGQHERSAGESSGGARCDDAPRPGESSRTSGLADDAVTRPPPPVLGGSRVPGRPPAHAAAIPSLPARQRSGRIRVVGAPDRRGRKASPERRLAASARRLAGRRSPVGGRSGDAARRVGCRAEGPPGKRFPGLCLQDRATARGRRWAHRRGGEGSESRVMGDERLERLREAIQQRAIFLGKDHPVVSPKGQGQSWLIDLRMTLLDGASLEL